MTAKEYLRQARTLDMRINNHLSEAERLRSLLERSTSTLTGMPRSGSYDSDRRETIMQRVWDLEAQIDTEIDKLVDLKTDIRKRINKVRDDRYQALLEARYLNHNTWEQIAEDMNYDRRQVTRLHGRALMEIDVPKCPTVL